MLYFKSRGEKTRLELSGNKAGSGNANVDVVVDTKYDSSSHNAQSGKAVAEATKQSLDKLTSQLGSVLRYKGSVDSYSALNSLANKEIGDVYDTTDTGANYVYTGSGWDKLSEDLADLVKQTTFNTLKSSISSHLSNTDIDTKHLDAASYEKLQDITIYSSEQLDTIVDEVLKQYVSDGTLLTEESLQQSLAEAGNTIQTTVTGNVKFEMQDSFLSSKDLDYYKREIDKKKSHLIKCDQADEIAVYTANINQVAPSLEHRKKRTVYMIGEGATVEEGGQSGPAIDDSKQMILEIIGNPVPEGPEISAYTIDLAPILGTPSSSTNESILARVDWRDGSASINIDDSTLTTSSILQHSYTPGENYKIRITGDIRWNGIIKNISPALQPFPSLSDILLSITIPRGKTSPIKVLGEYAFGSYSKLTSIPGNLFDNCDPTSVKGAFYNSGLTSIPEGLFSKCSHLTDVSYCFSSTQISSIPSNIFANNPSINNFTSCFDGCISVMNDLPAFWDSYPDVTEHNSCFCRCVQALNYQTAVKKRWTCPDDIPDPETGKMILYITVPADNTIINLGYQLGQTTEATSSVPVEGTINWGDNSELVVFHGNEGYSTTDNILVHTYSKGDYQITIEGIISWYCSPYINDSQRLDDILFYLTKIEIPEGYQSPIYSISGQAFQSAYKLTEIPSNLFENCREQLHFQRCFIQCTSLKAIPEGLFDNCIKVTDFSSTFYDCENITTIPERLFANCPEVSVFNHCFHNCKGLTSIPEKLFANNKKVSQFEECFHGCENITTIPDKLFEACTLVDTFYGCFYYTNLETIPENLFATCTNVRSFRTCFGSCSIQDIPEDLFATCVLANDFAFCFAGCPIHSIPDALFAHNNKIDDCQGVFNGCTSLTAIPETLFDNCPELTYLSYCFSECTNLQAIPDNLFSKNTKLYEIVYGFDHCTSISEIPKTLFSSCPDITYFDSCFNGCSGVTVELPTLWETYKNSRHPDCFCGCDSAPNYDEAFNAGWGCSEGIPGVEGGEIVLTVYLATNNKTVNLGPILGKWDGEASSIQTKGFLNWGDGTEIVKLTDNMGETNPSLSHTYSDIYARAKITISGKVKWNGTRVNQNGGTSPTNTTLCSQLQEIRIPTGSTSPLYHVRAHCFHNCSLLETIPAGLFDNAGATTNLAQVFDNCTSLTSVPKGLFDSCVNVTSFQNAFLSTAINNLPSGLFSKCTKNQTFHACFSSCKKLTSIPEDLFAGCTSALFFDICFNNCTSLTQIPANLFTHNTKATSFNNTFANCTSLYSIPSTIFEHNSKITHVINCFNNCTEVRGNLPELWLSYPNIESNNHSKCFCGCTRASNYQRAINAGYACTDDTPGTGGGDGEGSEEESENKEDGVMELHFTLYEYNTTISLDYCLRHLCKNKNVYGGTIDWGDGSARVTFINGDTQLSKFDHLYYANGDHIITITGKIGWGDYYEFSRDIPAYDIRYFLTKIVIPEGKKSPIYDVGKYAFSNSLLESIPNNLFDNCTQANYFKYCFSYCANITQIPENLFAKCTEAMYFNGCFSHCGISEIPENLFANCIRARDFSTCFSSCARIKMIPQKLFACSGVDFGSCFADCINLQEIPEGLFDGCDSALSFGGCFTGCKQITQIPENLFANCLHVGSFDRCFSGCIRLKKIPEKLFDSCSALTDYTTEFVDFDYCFFNCNQITQIPENLFANCPTARSFSGCFYGCNSLKAIPTKLFTKCTHVDFFDHCFRDCHLVKYLPPLWETHPTAYGYACFGGCTQANNYQNAVAKGWA